jgi:uncharacterized metal-binding protein YceD (DUF177 family)
MHAELTWKFPVAVAELAEAGKDFELTPDKTAREVLARHAGVNAVPHLTANLRLTPDGRGGATVEGTLRAAVTQNCVVTLEPFDNPIEENISLRFAPREMIEQATDGLVDLSGDDPPDPLVNGTLDLAAVIAEFLALAVDPYPRKPGAVFRPPADALAKDSPFAVLGQLKGRASDKKS